MREADSLDAIEHQNEKVCCADVAVVEGLGKSKGRKVLIERLLRDFEEFQLQHVIDVPYRALVVVLLRAELHPASRIAKIDALVLRRIDIVRPKQADVVVSEGVLVRFAAKREIDVVRRRQFKSGPALKLVVRR